MGDSIRFGSRRVIGLLLLCFLLLTCLVLIGGRREPTLKLAQDLGIGIEGLDQGSLARLVKLPLDQALKELSAKGEGNPSVSRLTLPAGYTSQTSGGRMIFAHFGDGEIPSLRQAMRTSFMLVNDSDYEAQGFLSFYRDDGVLQNVTIGGKTQSKFPVIIDRGKTLKMVTSGKGTLRSGWALLETNQPIAGSCAFSMVNSSDRVIAEVGVAESILRTEFTLFADTIGSANTGVAIVNPSENSQLTVNLELHGPGGNLVRTESVTVAPRGHVARFVNELFKSVGGISEFEGSLVLKGNQPFGGLTLRTLGSLMTSVPLVPPLDRFDYESQLKFPQVADGAQSGLKILTTVLLFNNTTLPSSGQIEFFQSDGAPMQVTVGGKKASSFPVSLGPGAVQRLMTTPGTTIRTGWARVTTDQPLHGAAMFHIQNAAGQPLTEVGVESGTSLEAFNVLVDTTGPYRTAVAVMNPSESDDTAEVTFGLFDSNGGILAEETREILPLTNSSFFVDELFKAVPGVKEMQGRVSVNSDEPVVALTLQQIDVLTTSAPVVIPQHGFEPKSVLEFPQNLTSSTPSVRWRLEQSGLDLTLETMNVMAPVLGLEISGVKAGGVIGQGIYFIDYRGVLQLGGIVQLVSTGGKKFDALASGPYVPPGTLLLSGSFSGTPSGGFGLSIGPNENRNANWNDLRRLEMDIQLIPGLIVTPSNAGNVDIVTQSTSASSKMEDEVRITCVSTQKQSFVKPAASDLQLYYNTPVYAGASHNLTLTGKGFDSTVEVGFPTLEGIIWKPIWAADSTMISVAVPPDVVEGNWVARKGNQESNTLLMRSLFTPSVQLTRSEGVGSASTFAPRAVLSQPARQLAIQSFEVRLLDCDRNLSTLAPGTTVGSASFENGGQGRGVTAYEVVVESSGADEAALKLVEPGETDVFAYITVTKATEDTTKSVTFSFELEAPSETPFVNVDASEVVVDLTGVLLNVSSGVSAPFWSAEVMSTPAQMSGVGSGIRLQPVMRQIE